MIMTSLKKNLHPEMLPPLHELHGGSQPKDRLGSPYPSKIGAICMSLSLPSANQKGCMRIVVGTRTITKRKAPNFSRIPKRRRRAPKISIKVTAIRITGAQTTAVPKKTCSPSEATVWVCQSPRRERRRFSASFQ